MVCRRSWKRMGRTCGLGHSFAPWTEHRRVPLSGASTVSVQPLRLQTCRYPSAMPARASARRRTLSSGTSGRMSPPGQGNVGVEKRFQPFDTALDADLAPRLHRALKLTRREAADVGLWRFLTVVARPDFVRHRWENKSWATMRTRFLRPGTRPDSNALGRLWWMAELTRADSDYSLTARMLKSQSLANAIFVRSLSYYQPAVVALVDTLENRGADEVERTMVRLTRWLGVTPLEGLSSEDISRRVRSFL